MMSRNKIIISIFSLIVLLGVVAVFFVGRKFDELPTKNLKFNELNFSEQDSGVYIFDFETTLYLQNTEKLSSEKAFSGKYSSYVKDYNDFSTSIFLPMPELDTNSSSNVNIGFWLLPESSSINAVFVFSIFDKNNNQIYWEGFQINDNIFVAINWQYFEKNFIIPKECLSKENNLKIYLWQKNKNNEKIFIDDISINFGLNEFKKPWTFFESFEEYSGEKISSKKAKTGFYSTVVKYDNDFSASIMYPMKKLNYKNLGSILLSFNIYSDDKNLDAVFVVTINDSIENQLLWHGIQINNTNFSPGDWKMYNAVIMIPEEMCSAKNNIKFYLWNRKKAEVFLDDVYVIFKEKNVYGIEEEPALDLLKKYEFSKEKNSPPYDFDFVFNYDINPKYKGILTKIFNGNNFYSGRFDKTKNFDQILYNSKNGFELFYFNQGNCYSEKIKFSPEIKLDSKIFSDENVVFVQSLSTADTVNIYAYNPSKKEFELINQLKIEKTENSNIAFISKNSNDSYSIVLKNGVIQNYFQNQNSELKYNSSFKTLSPNTTRVKVLKASFLGNGKKQLLLIYQENNETFYLLLDYLHNNWKLSPHHSNNKTIFKDNLDFNSDFHVLSRMKKGKDILLQLNRDKRFELKMIEFSRETYEILKLVEFKDFPRRQNPKYYEIIKYLTGDFLGEGRSQIFIFQDNKTKTDWLVQKAELYYFKD